MEVVREEAGEEKVDLCLSQHAGEPPAPGEECNGRPNDVKAGAEESNGRPSYVTAGAEECESMPNDVTADGDECDGKLSDVGGEETKPKSLSDVTNNYDYRTADDSWTEDSDNSSDESSTSEEEYFRPTRRPPPKSVGELDLVDLPAIEELEISVREDECLHLGTVMHAVNTQVVVMAAPNTPALDLDTVLFVGEEGKTVLGAIFDVMGPVSCPYYTVRFNNKDEITTKGIVEGMPVYCAPKTPYTSYIFISQLKRLKGSDASGQHDNEVDSSDIEYSDDELEANKHNKNNNNNSRNNKRNNNRNRGQMHNGGVPEKRRRPAHNSSTSDRNISQWSGGRGRGYVPKAKPAPFEHYRAAGRSYESRYTCPSDESWNPAVKKENMLKERRLAPSKFTTMNGDGNSRPTTPALSDISLSTPPPSIIKIEKSATRSNNNATMQSRAWYSSSLSSLNQLQVETEESKPLFLHPAAPTSIPPQSPNMFAEFHGETRRDFRVAPNRQVQNITQPPEVRQPSSIPPNVPWSGMSPQQQSFPPPHSHYVTSPVSNTHTMTNTSHPSFAPPDTPCSTCNHCSSSRAQTPTAPPVLMRSQSECNLSSVFSSPPPTSPAPVPSYQHAFGEVPRVFTPAYLPPPSPNFHSMPRAHTHQPSFGGQDVVPRVFKAPPPPLN